MPKRRGRIQGGRGSDERSRRINSRLYRRADDCPADYLLRPAPVSVCIGSVSRSGTARAARFPPRIELCTSDPSETRCRTSSRWSRCTYPRVVMGCQDRRDSLFPSDPGGWDGSGAGDGSAAQGGARDRGRLVHPRGRASRSPGRSLNLRPTRRRSIGKWRRRSPTGGRRVRGGACRAAPHCALRTSSTSSAETAGAPLPKELRT